MSAAAERSFSGKTPWPRMDGLALCRVTALGPLRPSSFLVERPVPFASAPGEKKEQMAASGAVGR